MGGRTYTDDCHPNIYICLCDVGGFLVVNVVMYGDEEKCTTKVMICFSEWVLWVV